MARPTTSRRTFLAWGLASSVCSWSDQSLAQGAPQQFRVGLLGPGLQLDAASESGSAFIAGMGKLGYIQGRNLAILSRGAGGQAEPLRRAIDEFVAAKVDAIVTTGFPPTVAAKATGLPTVVASGVGDPVATGLINSLSHPGGNVTGISDSVTELTAKRLGLLTEVAPSMRRLAMLWNSDDLAMTLRYQASAVAAERMGVRVLGFGVREPNDFNGAFESMAADRPDGILMVSDALTMLNRKRVITFALERRIPAIYERSLYVRDGGLMAYGADLTETWARVAALLDRILKGAKPADLPFEQPTRYEFALNLNAAKRSGLSIPEDLLARADLVIE